MESIQNSSYEKGKGKGTFTDRLFAIRTLSILGIISIIIYPFLYPSWFSGILPLLCIVLPLGYTFHPRIREHLYRRVAVSFIFAVSFLLVFLLISANVSSGRSEDLLRLAISLLLGIMGLVIVVDLFRSFKKVDAKWVLRLIPAMVFISTATLLIRKGEVHFAIPFSAIMISGFLLSIYAWLDLDRKDMNWFYLYCSFLAVAALPVIVLIFSRYISQPILLSFSCHASSAVRVRRKGYIGRRLERYRRRKHLLQLHENGEISDLFYSSMDIMISERNETAKKGGMNNEKKDILHETHPGRRHRSASERF